jgi:multicomponent Na+:H+ antiporter subunit D
MTAFAIGSLSMIGVPPMAGFISKWYMLLGASEAGSWFAIIIIIISTLLNAAYFLPIVYSAFMEEEKHDDDHHDHEHGEAPWQVVVPLCVTAGLTVLMFVFPGLPLALARALAGSLGL